MSTFPNSPRLMKGAIVGIDLYPLVHISPNLGFLPLTGQKSRLCDLRMNSETP